MPTARASVIIAYSFSGTAANRGDGSLTIQSPPSPRAGIVRPFRGAMMAEAPARVQCAVCPFPLL